MTTKKTDALDAVRTIVSNNKQKKLKSISDRGRAIADAAKTYVQAKQKEFLDGKPDSFQLTVAKGVADSPIYKISREKVVSRILDQDLYSEIFSDFAIATGSELKQIVAIIAVELTSRATDMTTISPVALKDDPELTWNRLTFTKDDIKRIKPEDVPGFMHFLKLIEDGADSLVLWTGSLLDPKSSRQQYLHLQSDGGTGKSTFLESISSVFGPEKVLRENSVSFNSQYFGEELEGVRLLAFPDENNTSFFSSGKFKRFTGEDHVTIQRKYRQPRTIKLSHKTMVFSNNEVQITASRADTRRLISVVMKSDIEPEGRKTWYEDLKFSGDKILAYCHSKYIEALEKNPAIRAYIPSSQDLTKKAIERKYAEILSEFYEKYEVTEKPEDKIKKSKVHKHICDELRASRTSMVLDQIKSALKNIGVLEGREKGVEYYRGIREIVRAPGLKQI